MSTMWETGLRTSTLQQMRVPDDVLPGGRSGMPMCISAASAKFLSG
jgi:hypothetical protein